MIQEKRHSMLHSSHPEVYNKDLEALVDLLRDKLEGAEIREEHLKERVKELQEKFYKVAITTKTLCNYDIAYFSNYEDAHKYLKEEVASFVFQAESSPVHSDSSYLRRIIPVPIHEVDTIRSWNIDIIRFGQTRCVDGSVKNLLTLGRTGELIRVVGEGK